MPLAALILSSEDDGEGALQPAELMIAGQSLFAYQIRLAQAAGAAHIVALVDQMPARLAIDLDRLREDGVSVDIARDARDAADRIHPDEDVLVIAKGLVADSAAFVRLSRHPRPALLCTHDRDGDAGFERIDADSQWSGLALIKGDMLRETAAMVGEWVLGPTLLRTAVQSGMDRLPLTENDGLVAYPVTQGDADAIARKFAMSPDRDYTGYVAGVYRALMSRLSPLLVGYTLPLEPLAAMPIGLVLLSGLLAVAGWLKSAMLLFLLAPVPASHVRVLARIGGRHLPLLSAYQASRLPGLFVLLAICGWDASLFPDKWGPFALGFWAATATALASLPESGRHRWFPEPEGVAFLLLAGLVVGWSELALMLIILHGLAAQITRARDVSGS